MYSGQFFASHWQATIAKSQRSKALEPSDFQEMQTLNSWEALQVLLKDPGSDGLAAIKPALSHYNTFMALFESKLGPTLDPAFFWGVLGILVQVCDVDTSDSLPSSPSHLFFSFNFEFICSVEFNDPKLNH